MRESKRDEMAVVPSLQAKNLKEARMSWEY
jgi:hypothetical protein